ncbi:hypothetical protein KL933_001260 [Ogataea haglerorum]|uniref:RING-type domain-containing protein n=1 Tax=Ogataea haglerorum TaxID=1937702 RepID=A0AAN6D9D6_9ASCO|nr:uncharacterized protein KL911_001916 [Ogataea haglerorum]KAG7698314.1 hypothetical protein KL915_002031 [Ogataea haglerorum]KAG7699393.1 hypothetical protein KL951_001110 [Ogataea haglerorum]KAG7721060.1 hypothetical protein KL913_000796 [Ogataea haglerorum]KAG7721814.1 hypothetical protein KL949_000792 [Ogataea haglerorum]KAG7730180.1 hypothetical protein KL933_001260 [Ogataea haglerorum]
MSVSTSDSGRLVLPAVVIQYADGTSQNLIIEVGPANSNNTNQAQETAARSPEHPQEDNLSAENAEQPSESSGIRGVDYPAFDVSNEGVYREQHIANNLLDNLISPFYRSLGGNNSASQQTNSISVPFYRNLTPASEPSRNIILTVNYIYGQPNPLQPSENNNSLSGSLILHVPNINESDDENLQVLIRLATTIALRTIATSVKKASGISAEQFDKLEVRKIADLKEKQCAICYDDYEDDNPEAINQIGQKRKRAEDETDETGEHQPKKMRKMANEIKSQSGTTDMAKKEVVYNHAPVEMPCGHVFGRGCLREWLKTNNSCPLCRHSMLHGNESSATRNSNSENETTIILPNLARVISEIRPLIEGFNSRHLTFVMPDQHSVEPSGAIPVPLPTPVTPQESVDSRSSSTNHSSVLGLVRGLLQNLNGRLRNPVRVNEDEPSNLINQEFLQRMPTIRTNQQGAPLNHSSFLRRRRRVLQPRRVLRSTGLSSQQFVNRDPLFPVGVASRRTSDGVRTSTLFSNSNEDDDPPVAERETDT